MDTSLADIGAVVCVLSGGVMFLAFVGAIIGAIFNINGLRKASMMIVIFSGLLSMIGFGVCFTNFSLGSMN